MTHAGEASRYLVFYLRAVRIGRLGTPVDIAFWSAALSSAGPALDPSLPANAPIRRRKPPIGKIGGEAGCLGEGESINSTSPPRKTQEFAYKATNVAPHPGRPARGDTQAMSAAAADCEALAAPLGDLFQST